MKIERTFPVAPGSAAEARHLVDQISSEFAPDLVENVRLLVSEVVTNAVVHGPDDPQARIHVRLDSDHDRVRVDVQDGGGGFVPGDRLRATGEPGGWGLYLVGRLADRWGVESEPTTRVWFEIDQPMWVHPEGPVEESRLVDAIGTALVATDRRGLITLWNRRAEELFGWSREEAVGRSVSDVLLSPEDPRAVRAIMRRIRNGISWEGDWHATTKRGEPIDVSVSSAPILSSKGKPLGMVGVFADIGSRVQAERRLAAQQAVARVLAGSTSVEDAAARILEALGRNLGWEVGALYLVEKERGRLRCIQTWVVEPERAPEFVAATRDFSPVLGLGLPGRVWEERRPVWLVDAARDSNFPRRAIASRDEIHGGLGFPMSLGPEVVGVVEFFGRSVPEPDHETLWMLSSLGAQLGQFVERARAREALQVSEARKSAILNSAHDAVVSMSASGEIVDFNPAAEQLFGYRRDEAIGVELASLLIPPRLRSQHRAALHRYLEMREPTILGRRVEMPALRSDGIEVPVELTVTLVDTPGEVSFTAYIRDISDRRTVEQQRAELLAMERVARSQAEAVNDRLTFLADASVVFASSLNYRKTLTKLARIAVPRIADWCSIEMVEPDGSIRSIELAHVDPDKVALAKAYRERFPPEPGSAIPRVIQSARSEIYPEIREEDIEGVDAEGRELIQQLGIRSAMVVPLIARGRAMGAITFLSSESGRRFERSDLDFAEDLARRAALSIDNARLYEERSHVARTLQRSLLPPKLPDIPGVQVAVLYEPAAIERNEVGGDFYDVFELPGRSWAIAIGDVCGKGVDAAALTGFARHTIRAIALHQPSPSTVLAEMSEALRREDGERFCTVAFARLETDDGDSTLTVACGGHPMPFVIHSDGAVEPVGVPGSLLGIFERVQLQERSVRLGRGDAIVFFTDGLIDSRRRPALDEPALSALLGRCAGLDAGRIADTIAEAISDPEEVAPDDVAILVLRVRP